ncbi:hypothetical protein LXL04_007705 [Taraxacum kok-saghyz]
MAEGEEDFVKIDLHYDGIFCPKPLVYFNDKMVPLRDFDFNEMNFSAFFTVIRKIAASRSIVLYYCLPHESLSDGLGVIQNEGDYREFLVLTFASPRKKVKVYVDYNNEPLLDWIEFENPDEVDDLEFHTEQDEEDEETPFADDIKAEHQEDAVETKPEPVDDHFLNKLCPKREEADGEFQQEYPFHNPNMAWDNMVPVIGMQFSNSAELKELLANYAVKHGLWASWLIQGENFQIKSLIEEHNCSRSFKLGSIVTYKWIGKHFVSEILERPKMSYRKMKAFISKKFNITVSIGQCRNARKFALSEIEGNLIEHYGRLWDYVEEISRSNPGSTVQALLDRGFFKGFYVCFKGVRDGWVDGCRKIISIDGCFLKGICKGDLEICPSVRRELEDMKVKQRFWAVYPCGYQQFEVRRGDQSYGVDLIRRVCDCRGWQLTGIPYLHVMAAIANLN